MSNGLIFPPDQQPIPDPITGRVTYTCTCNICGKVWDRGVNSPPPCTHTQDEMDAYFNAQPPGQSQRERWKVTTPPTPVSLEEQSKRLVNQARARNST